LISPPSPGRLLDARDLALGRQRAETDPADTELADVSARTPAEVAAVVSLHRPGASESPKNRRLLSHESPQPHSLPEREPELREQRPRLVVGAGGGHEGHLETPRLVDLVVFDLGKDELLAQPQRVVAVSVEAARRDPPEVTDPGQRHRDQLVDELVHPGGPQGDLDPDRQAGA